MDTTFTEIYEKSIWGDNYNREYLGSSGCGSTIEYNIVEYAPFLQNFIISNGVKTVVDLGCGDFKCGKLIYDCLDITYVGYDTYRKLVDFNSKTFPKPKYSFNHLDFCNEVDAVQPADLCILKDVLQHWPLQNIYNFLDFLVESKKFKYILICNCYMYAEDNSDIEIGSFRNLSATKYPLKKYNCKILFTYKTKEVSLIECC